MNRKEIDIPKTIFSSILLLVIVIIFVAVVINNNENSKRKKLYDDEIYMSEVISDYEDLLIDLTNKDSYEYNNQIINISDYTSVGDMNGANGVRYFDGVHQKDNDITKLIPKDFFFVITPNGYNYVGENYGFYIKTIKDLEEINIDSSRYNSSDYYKSIVILYTFTSYLPDITNLNDEFYFEPNIIFINEYHSYKDVDSKFENVLDSSYINDIKENGVVTYYNAASVYDISITNVKCSITLTNQTSFSDVVDTFDNDLTEINYTDTKFQKFCFNINTNQDESLRNDTNLVINFSFIINDGVWKKETNLGDITKTVEYSKEHFYSFRINQIVSDDTNLIFQSTVNYLTFKFVGDGSKYSIKLENNEELKVYNLTTNEYIVIDGKIDTTLDNTYLIIVYRKENKFSELSLIKE